MKEGKEIVFFKDYHFFRSQLRLSSYHMCIRESHKIIFSVKKNSKLIKIFHPMCIVKDTHIEKERSFVTFRKKIIHQDIDEVLLS